MGNLIVYIILILIGIIGLIGATFLFPVLATLVSKIKNNKLSNPTTKKEVKKINILIPAHNEEGTITKTIESIQNEIFNSKEKFPEINFSIILFADNCQDKTEGLAKNLGVEVFSAEEHLGKWKALEYLVKKSSDSDWIIFVDSGIVWSNDILTTLVPYMKSESFSALMPSYKSKEANFVERISWSLEKILKSLENFCGGPITSHGATVAYETKALISAFEKLEGTEWLNDDVVIPLMVRINKNTTKYLPQTIVKDESKKPSVKREFTRRLRLIRGNFEWISLIKNNLRKETLPITLLSCRRLFRVLWGYWLLFIGLGFLIIMSIIFLLTRKRHAKNK